MNIRFKIAFIFSLLVTVLFLVAGILTYQVVQQERQKRFKERIKNRVSTVIKVYEELEPGDFSVLKKMDEARVSSIYDKSVAILDADQRCVYYYADEEPDTVIPPPQVMNLLKKNNEHYYIKDQRHYFLKKETDTGKNFTVIVSAEDIYGEQFLDMLKRTLIIIISIAVAISIITGLLFARSIVKPIAKIISDVKKIGTNNLDSRIVTKNTKDELYYLAETFNDLLERLRASFAIQRRFISNASHELSSPLTVVSSQLQVLLQQERTPDEYKKTVASVNEDIVELQLLTKSLLEIAEIDSRGAIELADVRMDELLFKVIDDIRKKYPGYTVNLDFETFAGDENLLAVYGNYSLLYVALKNVVDNACKYSDNKMAEIVADFLKDEIIISVKNTGVIISEAEAETVFQPFFRSGSVINMKGFGLGLTMSRQILSIHKGSIQVSSNTVTGTVFIIRLPH